MSSPTEFNVVKIKRHSAKRQQYIRGDNATMIRLNQTDIYMWSFIHAVFVRFLHFRAIFFSLSQFYAFGRDMGDD